MDYAALSGRAVLGMYRARLEESASSFFVNSVSNLFESDQAFETYPFLGQSPAMREWIGGRQVKGLYGNQLTITNKHYESTLEIALRDLRRDKTGQLDDILAEHAMRAQQHWDSLLTTLISAGATTTCYDGQYFFDTDHTEGENTTSQSNSISVDISALPGAVHGSTTAPSVEEMQQSIMAGVSQICGFKDDRNEPLNVGASGFVVVVPVALYNVALMALSPVATQALQQNLNPNIASRFRVDVEPNPRLTWTDKFAVFRTDSRIKALIRQSETEIGTKLKDENSEFAFDNDAIQIGVDAWRNVGYGYWQRACLVTMT